MANTTTLNETLRSPIDGTEQVRLATVGANWKAPLSSIISTLVPPTRTTLNGTTNYYVAATGNNSNNGSLISPWATLQHACDFISDNLDINGHSVIINVGAGSFVGCIINQIIGCGFFQIKGAGSTLTTLTDTPSGRGTINVNQGGVTIVAVTGVNIFGSTANKAAVSPGGFFFFLDNSDPDNPLDADIAFSGHPADYVEMIALSSLYAQGTFTVTGDGSTIDAGIYVQFGAIYQEGGASWTLTGTPQNISFGWMTLQGGGRYIDLLGNSYTGAFTGKRYQLTDQSVAGGFGEPGPTYFPGTVAGSCDVSSCYGAQIFAQPITNLPTTSNLNQSGSWGTFQSTQYSGLLAAANNGGNIEFLGRIKLTANITYYVATTGSNSNPGTSGSPWATIQHAIDFISSNIDTGGFVVTISVGAGTFVGFGAKSVTGGGLIYINGAGVASTTVQAGPNDGVFNLGQPMSWLVQTGVIWRFANLTIDRSAGGGFGGLLYISGNNRVFPGDPTGATNGDFNFSFSSTGQVLIYLEFAGGAYDEETGPNLGNTTISTSTNGLNLHSYIQCNPQSYFGLGATYTLSGSPAFNDAFLDVDGGVGFSYASYSGASTGKPYLIQNNGFSSFFGTSAGLPGNVAGSLVNGGAISP